jgi:pimeloyl-ACP methyl ester carboxylesterase
MSQSIPDTQFVKSGDAQIAYQVFGEGDEYLLLLPGWVSHVEHGWQIPTYAAFLRKLAEFRRVILIDRSGTGLSSPSDQMPTLEQRVDEICAVLDAEGIDRVDLLGISESGALCMHFAATLPDRTGKLVLNGTFAQNKQDDDHPWSPGPEDNEKFLNIIEEGWGQGISARIFVPSRKKDADFIQAWGEMESKAATAKNVRAILAMTVDNDVRPILSSITAPTAVVHRTGDRAANIKGGRYIADHIPGAKLVEVEGNDHLTWEGDTDSVVDAAKAFLTA